ncbi:cell wall-binding repeat-containing protein [Peptostreptococcus faecalis]|uniref:cell wall-binding repeat-containing protein n=1 Tax=Peptostreptococcus faecalis TaxID=2045015 RepID=UPI000C7A3347|nr:cell wall-binding repeat-containing protein [Peptostreptococcus faecalis]
MKKLLALMLSLAFIIPSTNTIFASGENNITRISGGDRYETCVRVNKSLNFSSDKDSAVIANGNDFKTALYGSYLSSSLDIPYFISKKDFLSSNVVNELDRLKIKKVYLLGDNNVLSDKVDNLLKQKSIKTERIFNKKTDNLFGGYYTDNIDLQVDGIIHSSLYGNSPRGDISYAILINDNKFSDLLTTTPFAGALAKSQHFGLYSFDTLKTTGTEGNTGKIFGYIIGGYDSIPSEFETYDTNWDGSYRGDKRIHSEDRYKTAIEIANAYKTELNKDIKTVVIVNGDDFADALSSGLIASNNDAAILLTKSDKLNEDTRKYILENNIKNFIIIGGENSISKDVENELNSL